LNSNQKIILAHRDLIRSNNNNAEGTNHGKNSKKSTKPKTHKKALNKGVQVEDLDETQEIIPLTYAITAYGADYPFDSIVKRIGTGDIIELVGRNEHSELRRIQIHSMEFATLIAP
jgi:hypothetical protein